jgi:hypothetical protein
MRASDLNLTSSRRTPGPIITGVRGYGRSLPECQNGRTRRMGPGVRRDDAWQHERAHQIQLSSPGLTGRPSTPRRLGKTPMPLEYWIPAFAGMTTLLVVAERRPPECQNGRTRRMGPGVRRDDAWQHERAHQIPLGRSRSRQTPLSSPGLTGRPSTPRPLDSRSGASGILDPRFRGDDSRVCRKITL